MLEILSGYSGVGRGHWQRYSSNDLISSAIFWHDSSLLGQNRVNLPRSIYSRLGKKMLLFSCSRMLSFSSSTRFTIMVVTFMLISLVDLNWWPLFQNQIELTFSFAFCSSFVCTATSHKSLRSEKHHCWCQRSRSAFSSEKII